MSTVPPVLLFFCWLHVVSSFLIPIHKCPNDCHWNGNCDLRHGRCTCFEGFYNTDCSGDCGCAGHGTCKSDNTCQCDDGWKWSVSDRKCVWDCHCQHGQQCIGPGICGCQQTCVHGTCWNGQCECWEGYTGETCSTLNPSIMSNRNSTVGMNIGGITYYSSEIKFVDVAKESSEWVTQRLGGHTWDTKEHSLVQWQDDGHPQVLPDGMVLEKLMLRAFGEHAPKGIYTILYDGDGDVSLNLVKSHIIYNGKGRLLANLTVGKGGIGIKVSRTNPANPIHNLRVILPGFEDRHKFFPYYPIFLESIARYSEFRFMDFLHTNNHEPEPTTWNSRKSVSHHTLQGTDGGPIELAVYLSNLMGSDPWINIPHAADDNYVTHFANYVKANLRPDLKVYVEYSNEVWNGIFRQSKYCNEKGKEEGLDTSYKATFKYYNKRSTEIMNIWKSVYGIHSDKLVPVWAWQTGYEDYYRQALEDLGIRTKSFAALAITAYFGCQHLVHNNKSQLPHMTNSQIGNMCRQGIQTNSRSSFQHFMNVSKAHGLALVMYEGGPGLVEPRSQSDAITNKLTDFNRNDLIESSVTDLLETWNNIVTNHNPSPGGLFNYFSSCGLYGKYGSWGLLEYIDQHLASVPKYRAVQKFITSHSRNLEVGPKCSFILHGHNSYGCFIKNSNPVCAWSNNKGSSWHNYPLVSGDVSRFVLDGYNADTGLLFIRAVDSIASCTYYTIKTTGHAAWKTINNFEYHRQLADRKVQRRLPNGYFLNLDAHLSCSH